MNNTTSRRVPPAPQDAQLPKHRTRFHVVNATTGQVVRDLGTRAAAAIRASRYNARDGVEHFHVTEVK